MEFAAGVQCCTKKKKKKYNGVQEWCPPLYKPEFCLIHIWISHFGMFMNKQKKKKRSVDSRSRLEIELSLSSAQSYSHEPENGP